MSEVRVESWNDLNDELFENSWREHLQRYRSSYAFRGMSDDAYSLTTSLARLGENARAVEAPMLRAFRKYALTDLDPDFPVWNWLAIAQHHGLSTRLLDCTYSPLVAMHFATSRPERFDCDGVIWSMDYVKSNRLLPERLQEILEDEGSDVFTAEMLSRAASSLEEFEYLAEEPFIAFFEPPSLDQRIINQYALFVLLSDPTLDLDQWLCQHPDVFKRIVVAAELKSEIRDRLDQANVTERVLLPGLDGLSQWLNRYYTPRREEESPHPEKTR